jgi:oxygen-dependent protoporphyrinogen oxidase
VSINRWQRAIPQYRIGHLSLIERVERLEREQPGLFVAGNFRGGISVGDCVASSERTAFAVQSHLKGQ